MGIRDEIREPYFIEDKLAGLDFNREIVEPGVLDGFPEGALGIRVDDDFWTAAVLPLSYRDVPLKEIVEELWPEYKDEAKYCPDHGSVEQKIYFSNEFAKSAEAKVRHLDEALREANEELKRLRAGRFDLHEQHRSRKWAESNYFIEQYEHLLVAVAHPFEPREEESKRGVCKKCGLLSGDRVHANKYIELHTRGYEPMTKPLPWYDE